MFDVVAAVMLYFALHTIGMERVAMLRARSYGERRSKHAIMDIKTAMYCTAINCLQAMAGSPHFTTRGTGQSQPGQAE